MSQHEKFETWFGGEYGDDHDDTGISFERKGDGYLHQGVDDAWNVWQASRRAALEEAWAICNANAAKLNGPKETESGYVALVLTADDIRAIAKETNNG